MAKRKTVAYVMYHIRSTGCPKSYAPVLNLNNSSLCQQIGIKTYTILEDTLYISNSGALGYKIGPLFPNIRDLCRKDAKEGDLSQKKRCLYSKFEQIIAELASFGATFIIFVFLFSF